MSNSCSLLWDELLPYLRYILDDFEGALELLISDLEKQKRQANEEYDKQVDLSSETEEDQKERYESLLQQYRDSVQQEWKKELANEVRKRDLFMLCRNLEIARIVNPVKKRNVLHRSLKSMRANESHPRASRSDSSPQTHLWTEENIHWRLLEIERLMSKDYSSAFKVTGMNNFALLKRHGYNDIDHIISHPVEAGSILKTAKDRSREVRDDYRMLQNFGFTTIDSLLAELPKLNALFSIPTEVDAFVSKLHTRPATPPQSAAPQRPRHTFPPREYLPKSVDVLQSLSLSEEVEVGSSLVQRRLDEWEDLQKKAERVSKMQSSVKQLDFSLIESMMKCKKTSQRVVDLKAVLQHSRNCEASDDRDRIYAFISLAPDGYAIEPSYTQENTILHVLVHTVQRIVEYENNLSILSHVRGGRDKEGCYLPTWVPDWTSRELETDMRKYCLEKDIGKGPDVWKRRQTTDDHGNNSNCDDDGDTFYEARSDFDGEDDDRVRGSYELEGTRFRRNKADETDLHLKVTGFCIGVLQERGGPVEGFSHLQTFFSASGLRAVTTSSPGLEDEVWVLCGYSFPVALRVESTDTYSFLGDVVLYEQDGQLSELMIGRVPDAYGTICETDFTDIWLE